MGLAGRLLYGVLIANDRKCFIARKLLHCWELNQHQRADRSADCGTRCRARRIPQHIGVSLNRLGVNVVHSLLAPDDAELNNSVVASHYGKRFDTLWKPPAAPLP